METKVVAPQQGTVAYNRLWPIRALSDDEWVERFASGTLRKNKRLPGMRWRQQYIDERVAWEFGWEFKCLPSSRVTFGDAITSGDCKPLTELGWFADRHIQRCPFVEDVFEVKYITAAPHDDDEFEGAGLVMRQTSAPWLRPGHIVFAVIARFDPARGAYLRARNPS
jgi:hypothetical protein